MNLGTLLIMGFIIELFLALFVVKFFNIYLITVIISLILNVVSSIYEKIRTKELGFSVQKIKGYKGNEILNMLTCLIPAFNLVYASIKYFEKTDTTDVRYIFTRNDKLVPFKEAVKEKTVKYDNDKVFNFPSITSDGKIKVEYNSMDPKEFEIAKKMVVVDDYFDDIIMNVNLSKEKKIELLKHMRKQMYLTNNVKITPNKILKMSKNK